MKPTKFYDFQIKGSMFKRVKEYVRECVQTACHKSCHKSKTTWRFNPEMKWIGKRHSQVYRFQASVLHKCLWNQKEATKVTKWQFVSQVCQLSQ